MKNYVGVKCPKCGGQLDMIVEPAAVTFGFDRVRSAISQTPTVHVQWGVSVISHDCENPQQNGNSFIDKD